MEKAREKMFFLLCVPKTHFFCIFLQYLQLKRNAYDTLPYVLPWIVWWGLLKKLLNHTRKC